MPNIIPLAEVKKHKRGSVWIVIHNNVYDVSKFINEHPGGAESLLNVAGEDGTQAFEDVGHSEDAKLMMQKYKIGSLAAEESIVHLDSCTTRRPKKKSTPCPEKIKPPLSVVIVPKARRWWLWALLAMGTAVAGSYAYKRFSG